MPDASICYVIERAYYRAPSAIIAEVTSRPLPRIRQKECCSLACRARARVCALLPLVPRAAFACADDDGGASPQTCLRAVRHFAALQPGCFSFRPLSMSSSSRRPPRRPIRPERDFSFDYHRPIIFSAILLCSTVAWRFPPLFSFRDASVQIRFFFHFPR